MGFKIYTKTGDKGETSLIGGVRVPKFHLRIESYGTIDELNSHLGMVKDMANDRHTREVIYEIQDRLFTIGSVLASDPEKSKMKVPDLHLNDVTMLETEMDKMEEHLPELKNFILPGGHPSVSACHIARCVCRRAERLVVQLQTESEVPEIISVYLNRLSDYLFMLSRWISKELKIEETPWRPRM